MYQVTRLKAEVERLKAEATAMKEERDTLKRRSATLSLSLSHERGTPRSLSLSLSRSLMKEERDPQAQVRCTYCITIHSIGLDPGAAQSLGVLGLLGLRSKVCLVCSSQACESKALHQEA